MDELEKLIQRILQAGGKLGGFLVPPDHLPTEEDGKRSHRLMGAAWAALHGGYRGNKYSGPGKAEAIAKLKKMYAEEKMELPGDGHAQQMLRVTLPCRVLQAADGEGRSWDVEITKLGPAHGTPAVDWPPEVVQRDLQVFDGLPSYEGHLSDAELRQGIGHPVSKLLGHISNPRMGDGAAVGTLHLLNPEEWGPKFRTFQSLPEGIVGMSLDVRFVPDSKRGAGGRQRVAQIVRHPLNSLDLVSPPGGGGRILRAVAAAGGEGWEEFSEVSPAAEIEPTARTKQGGTTVKEKIKRVLQAIGRFDSARAAALETEIAGFKNDAGEVDEEKQFERVTQAMLEIEVPKPAAAAATQVQQAAPALSEADRAIITRADETNKQLRVAQSQLLLRRKLDDSRLPKPLKEEVERRFAGREFADADVDTEIKAVRQTYAQLVPDNRVTQTVVSMGLDKLQIAMDKLFGVTHENKFEMNERGALRITQGAAHPSEVPGFRGIREAYIALTGDHDVTGDPQTMRRVTQLESTAAFPLALANTLNRLLVREYAQVEYSWQKIVSEITAPMDFKTQERVRTGYFGDLSSVSEDGTFDEISTITDEQATYIVGTFGNTLTITRRAIINDDIGLMKRNVGLLGRAAARTLARQIWNQLLNNVTYGPDSLPIFDGAHNNTGTALLDSVADAITALDAVKAAMYTQTEKDSGERLALRMRYLVVPIELQSQALKLNNSQFTVDGSNVRSDNPYYNYFGQGNGSQEPDGIITEPLITDPVEYFLFADPNQVDTIEVGFLQGRQAPEFFLADNPLVGSMFTQDRIVYKVRFEFGTTVLDYRGMYLQKNS